MNLSISLKVVIDFSDDELDDNDDIDSNSSDDVSLQKFTYCLV